MDVECPDVELRRFAAAVVHELRNPLWALSAEVEVSLRRERSAAAYRETLARVADLIEELVHQTRDLAAFADPGDPQVLRSRTTPLGAFVNLERRYEAGTLSVALDEKTTEQRVIGDESLLTRAFTLLVDHAVRHRPAGAAVRIRTTPSAEASGSDDSIVLVIDAMPGLPVNVWAPFAGSSSEQAPVEPAAMVWLTAAARIIAACGGSVDVSSLSGPAAVRVRLCTAQS